MQQPKTQVETKPVSDTHYLIIDCKPGQPRPDTILNMILTDDTPDFEEDDALLFNDKLEEQDFSLIYTSFGEWKYGVYKDKEQIFELNLPKIIDHLTSLYRCGIIRYAEWNPK
jgi:hypothetical protein